MESTINSLIQLCDGKLLHGVVNAIHNADNMRKYRHRRCYACGSYGHIASMCGTKCHICSGQHAAKDCLVPLIRSYHDLHESINRFIKKTNMRTYENLSRTVERFDNEKYIDYIESLKKDLNKKIDGYKGLVIQSESTVFKASRGRTLKRPVPLKIKPSSDGATGRVGNAVPSFSTRQLIVESGKTSLEMGIRTMGDLNKAQPKKIPMVQKSRVVVPVLQSAKPSGTISLRFNQMAVSNEGPRVKPNTQGFLINLQCVKKNLKIHRRTIRAIKRNGYKFDKLKMRMNEVYRLKDKAVKTARAITTAAKLNAQNYDNRVSAKLNEISRKLDERAQYNQGILAEKQALYNKTIAAKREYKESVDSLYKEVETINRTISNLYARIKNNPLVKGTGRYIGTLVPKYNKTELYEEIDELKDRRAGVYAKINALKQTKGNMAEGQVKHK